MADRGSVNVIVNRTYQVDTQQATAAIRTLKSELAGLKFHEYYQDEETLIKRATEALRSFTSEASRVNASEVIKTVNALQGLTGKDLSSLFPDVSDVTTIVSRAKSAAEDIADAFSSDAFSNAFMFFDLMEKGGANVVKTFNEISSNREKVDELTDSIGQLENQLSQMERRAEEAESRLSGLLDDGGIAELQDKAERLAAVQKRAIDEFNAFLTTNNIAADQYGRFYEIYDAIEEGTMTAGQAIARFKEDYAYLLPQGAEQNLDAFAVKLEEIFSQLEEVAAQVHNLASSSSGAIDSGLRESAEIAREQGEVINEYVQSKSALADVSDIINTLINGVREAGGAAGDAYSNITSLLTSLRDLSEIDPGKLKSLGTIFSSLAITNGFKFSEAQGKHLTDFLEKVGTITDVSALRALGGISFDAFKDLNIRKSSLETLATFLPVIAEVNVDNLKKLSEIDFSNLNNITVPDIADEGISALSKLSNAFEKTEKAVTSLANTLSTSSNSAVSSIKKMSEAGLTQGEISSRLRSNIGSNGASTTGVSLRHVGFTKEDADAIAGQIEQMEGRIANVSVRWKTFANGAKDAAVVTVNAIGDVGETLRRDLIYTLEETEDEFGEIKREWKLDDSQGKATVDFEKRRKATEAALEEERKETERVNSEIAALYEQRDRELEEQIKRDEERGSRYIENERKKQEAAENAADAEAKRQTRLYEYDENTADRAEQADIAETERINAEIAAAYEWAAQEQEKLIELDNKKAERYIANRKREEEATERALERSGISAGDAYFDEVDAIERANAADEKRDAKVAQSAKEYEDAERRKQKASEMTAEQAEAELTRLQSLQLDYQAQIDKAEGAGYESDTVESLRRNFAEIAKEIPILESVRDGTNKTAKSTDEYKKKVAALKDQLVLLKKELAGQMSSGSAFTTLEGNQANIASKTIDARKADLERYIGSVSDQGYGSSDEVTKLQNMIPLYDQLNERIREGTITQKDYTESMKLLNVQSDEAVRSLDARIAAEKKEEAEKEKAYRQEMQNLNIQKQANEYIGKASNLLRDYSAAEHSRNESSRKAYASIKEYKGLLEDLYKNRESMDPREFARREKEYTNKIEENSRVIEANGDAHMTAFGKIGRAIKTHLTTLTATASIGSVMRYIRQMIDAVKEIDSAMTELKKVTDETDARYEQFLTNAATRAKNLSATISDTVNATANFARLGLSLGDAEMAADAAIVYKSVGDGINSIDDAAESIISTMKAFGIEANDAMSIVDKFNEVGNSFAIGSAGVGEALKRSASAMYAANNTLEESIGLATAANTILQNPQSVGTTLKTVSMYIRAAKTELEEAGEDTEGIAESTGKLRELIKQITREGGTAVDIMADENRFKSTYQILEEISEVWDKISDTNQAALLEKLGGKRNANAIAAILENFDIARKAMETATNSEGSAMKELEKFQQSIEGHLVALKTAFQELSQTVIDSEFVKFVTDFGTVMLNGATAAGKFAESFGGLKTAMIAVSGVTISKIVKGFINASEGTKVFSGAIGDLIQRFIDARKNGENYITFILKFIDKITTVPGAITAITVALTAAFAIYSKVRQAERERRDAAIEAGKAADAESKEITELYDKYTDLNEKIKEDDSLKGDLEDTTESLLKKLGIEKDKVDELADSYGGLSEAIANATMDQLKENQIDLVEAYQAAVKDLQDAVLNPNNIPIAKGLIGNTDLNAIKSLVSEGLIDKFEESTSNGGAIGGYSQYHLIGSDNLKTPEGIYDAYERLTQILIKLEGTSGVSQRLIDAVKKERNQIEDKAIAYKNAADALNDNLIQQGIIDSRNIEDLADIRNHIINVVGANRVYAGSIEDVIETVDELLKKDERFAEFYGLIEEGADNAASGQSKAIQRVETDFDRFKDEISKLGSALDEFQENKEISTETYQKLAGGEDKDKYADLFKISDAGIELQTDKLNAYIESLEQEYGAKMALNGATEDEIRMMMALGSTLITLSEDTGNVASEIVELRGYIDDLNKGNELSWDEADALSKKYPKLANAIHRAEKGYRVEIEAIEELIAVKSEYLRLTDQEMYVIQARNALNLYNKGNTTASSKIDEIFTKYQEIYGKAITSLEEFKTGYTLVFDGAFEGAYEAYEDYIEALIESNKKIALSAEVARDALEGTGEGIDVDKIEDATKSLNDLKSELDDLTDVMKKLNEGTELSTSETITLLMKYPTLRDYIIKTANGYKIETSAIKELIAAKVQLITTTDREKSAAAARQTLVSTTKDANAEKADIVFADYLSKNGRNIETIEEYKEAYQAYWGYAAKASKDYAQAKIDALKSAEEEVLDPVLAGLFDDYINGYQEGYTPEKESSSSEKDVETEFERMYKLHQHYLAMDQETVEQYLNWLDGAYKASYAAGEMELDDYYKYEEEVYEKRKELFQTNLDVLQHQIDLLSHKTTDTSAEQIAIYEQMQREVNAQANRYRAKGIKDNDELIRELQNQWWQYEENIRQLREGAFNDWVSDRKFVIEQLKLDKADADVVIGAWKEILVRINAEIEYYSNKGYDITTDVIQSLLGELQTAKDAMIEALDEVVQKANEAVDGFENVYKTLTDAAKEYASTGYLSVDSLQSILSLGPKYLDMLVDENGQLIINEDRLQKVIAARTEEMAAETALSYAKQILLATEQDDADALRDLTQATAASSGATWDLAYATLGYAKALAQSKGMSTDFYDDAISYVTKMQSVTKTAVDSVSSYYLTLKDGYVSQAEGLETILKLTEDMIKQENSDRVDALEKEKELYKDIIDEKKEILRLTKEQEDHDRDTADKLKEIADLQSRIDQLALDDSREAQAQRTKLEAELYEKQKALADNQADYAYEAQTEALDKQYEEFEKEKDDEIDALKDMLGSAEQLYQAAIARIDSGWDTLYQDLLNWNYKYGSTLQKDLTAAWDAAKAAAERYGSFVNAMEGVKDNTNLGAASTNPSSEAVQAAVNAGSSKFTGARDIIDRMRANSIAWFTGDQAFLSGENRRLAEEYKAATGKALTYKNGLWYEEGSSTPIYDLSKDQAARNQIGAAVVATMKANSEMWKTADPSQRPDIEKRNERLAAELANFLGIPITKTKSGVWMLGDTPLYSVTKFHSGGIAGGGTVRQNEVMALLKKGEAILDDKREEALYRAVDFVEILSNKIGKVIDAGRINSLLNGTAPLMRNYGTPALAGGIGTMNFSPTVNVTIAGAGDLSESTARKYGNIAADSVLEQLKNAFSQRGVSSVGNGILK